MDHFAGLDVSVKETSVCIVDDTGKLDGVFQSSRLVFEERSMSIGPRLTLAKLSGWSRILLPR
jgi:hypothetical protein